MLKHSTSTSRYTYIKIQICYCNDSININWLFLTKPFFITLTTTTYQQWNERIENYNIIASIQLTCWTNNYIILRTVIINFRISVFTTKHYYTVAGTYACIDELYTLQNYAYNGILNDQVVNLNILSEINNNNNNCCDDNDNLIGAFHSSEISIVVPSILFGLGNV